MKIKLIKYTGNAPAMLLCSPTSPHIKRICAPLWLIFLLDFESPTSTKLDKT